MVDNLATAWVAAGSAFVGVVLSQVVVLLKEYLDKRHQRQKLYREKLESLAAETDRCSELMSRLVAGFPEHVPPNAVDTALLAADAARRARLLARLYFPELQPPCSQFLESLLKLTTNFTDSHYATMPQNAKEFNSARQLLDQAIMDAARLYV